MKMKEMKEKILAELDYENRVTGAELAEKFSVTKSYISKIVKSLRADGVEIDSSPTGYVFRKQYNPLSEKIFYDNLNALEIGKNLVILDEVDSTNNYAKKLAQDGAPHGTLVISDCQTSGKGRRGRTFVSPKNVGLYYSVILRSNESFKMTQKITACASVAVAEALDELYEISTQIKWVNDVYLNKKKVCGILTEASINCEDGNLDYAVIGIGVNVYHNEKAYPSELSSIITSLEKETGKTITRCKIAARISDKLEKYLKDISTNSFIPIYRQKSNIIGKMITFTYNHKEMKGIACDIDEDAALVIKLLNGEELHLNSGEIQINKSLFS